MFIEPVVIMSHSSLKLGVIIERIGSVIHIELIITDQGLSHDVEYYDMNMDYQQIRYFHPMLT